MKISKTHIITAVILIIVFILEANCFAGDIEDIKERMKARLPEINVLKTDGSIGENYLGYLEFLGTKKPQKKLVADENKDRKSIYKSIAESEGSTTENVGIRRAIKIAAKAKPGHWLQGDKKNWYKKQ